MQVTIRCLQSTMKRPNASVFAGLNTKQIRGRLIASACTMRGLTVKQLAEAVFLSPRQLHRYLNGLSDIDVNKLEQIAEVTGQTLDFFDTRELVKRD